MKINVNLFDDKQIDSAIRRIERTSQALERLSQTLTEKLAKIGCEVVSEEYTAMADFYENKPFTVETIRTDKGYAIIATGENVMFLEFGAGDMVEDYEHPEADLPPIASGEWSINEGSGVYARHGFWHYRRKFFRGTYATKGFYYATEEMKEKAVEIAKEVFAKMPQR